MQTRKANREKGCSSQLSVSVCCGKKNMHAFLVVVNKVRFDMFWHTGALVANRWYVGLRMQWSRFKPWPTDVYVYMGSDEFKAGVALRGIKKRRGEEQVDITPSRLFLRKPKISASLLGYIYFAKPKIQAQPPCIKY